MSEPKSTPSEFDVKALDSLDDICTWLSTFRAREVRHSSRDTSEAVKKLEMRYRERRAELA